MTYHLGFSSDWHGDDGRKIHLSLCFNPSHLEYINPVALGRMRAKQDRVGDDKGRLGMVMLVHGDAAFAGEGVVQESLNMSRLSGYATGGTLHVIVDNQIGFTTPPQQGRSTIYASDVAKMLQVPIFHVNGEHPEAVAQVVDLAMDFRERFHRDVVIDMFCYRRWGHNETDEPGFTQPLLYQAIEHQRSVRDGYLDHLLTLNEVTREEADRIADDRYQKLELAFEEAKQAGFVPASQTLTGIWQEFRGGDESPDDNPATGVPAERLTGLLERLTSFRTAFISTRSCSAVLSSDWRWRVASGRSTGRLPKPWRSHRWPSKGIAFASPARTRSAALSAIGTPCCMTWSTGTATCRWPISRRIRRRLKS